MFIWYLYLFSKCCLFYIQNPLGLHQAFTEWSLLSHSIQQQLKLHPSCHAALKTKKPGTVGDTQQHRQVVLVSVILACTVLTNVSVFFPLGQSAGGGSIFHSLNLGFHATQQTLKTPCKHWLALLSIITTHGSPGLSFLSTPASTSTNKPSSQPWWLKLVIQWLNIQPGVNVNIGKVFGSYRRLQ